MADGLLNKASIILTPTGYKAGTLYNVAPVVEPYEDFDFARASVASRVNSSGLVEMVGRTLGSNLVQNGDFSELGSELVTSWTNKDFISFSSSGSNITQMVSSGNGNNCYSTTTITSGKTYKLEFSCSQNILAQIRLSNNTNLTSAQTALSNPSLGLNTVYFTASSNYNYIGFYAASTFTDTQISSFTLKQVDPNDYWTLGTGWSIGDDKLEGTNVNAASAEQSGFTFVDKTFEVSYTISDYSQGSVQIYLGGVQSTSLKNVNGVHTETIKITSGNSTLYVYGVSNFIGSIDNVSVKEVIDTNNIPRISYDSNGQNGHILLEPTSTNFLPYSNDFSQSNWVKQTNITATYNTTETLSPDGTYNATKLVGDGTDGIFDSSLSITGDVTRSVYLKSVSGTVTLKLKDSNINIGIETLTVTTEWQRFYLSGDNGSSLQGIFIFNIPSSGVYMWGAQVENSPYPTSYIPTLTGSTVTRATETATGAGSAELINSTEGVLYAEIAAFEVEPDFFISMNDGTQNNRVIIKFSDAVDNQLTAFTINSTNFSSITHTISDFTQYNKIALSYNSSYLKLFVNGQEVGTSVASPNLAVGLNVLNLSNTPTDKNVKGKVKAVAVFNEALSDSELTQLTT